MTKHRTDAAATLLVDVRADRAAENAAAARILARAAEWADLHPPVEDDFVASATIGGRPTGAPLAGEGTPEVDEGCIAELAAALRCSTDAGTTLIGQALELRHRLPRLWALVHAGKVAAWQARLVAGRTISLTREAATFVDDQVAAVTGKVGVTQLDRVITTAITRFMPEEAERQRVEAEEKRRFDIFHDQDGRRHGLAEVVGVLDLPDALDLDAAIGAGARMLAEAGIDKSLDVRRSMAAGELARSQPALNLTTSQPGLVDDATTPAASDPMAGGASTATESDVDAHPGSSANARSATNAASPAHARTERDAVSPASPQTGATAGSPVDSTDQPHHSTNAASITGRAPATPWPGRAPSQVTLYVHLSADALTGGSQRSGWVGNTGIPVTAGQIRDWCGRPDAKITVRPVIDLNTTATVDGYEVPDRLREHIALRDRTCVFPWCSRPAHPRSTRQRNDGTPTWSTDADHIEPYDTGGPTSTDNLAPLCRKHHRLKTHTPWRYRMLALGHYEWTSPHGLCFRRGPDGSTTDLSAEPPATPAAPASRRRQPDQPCRQPREPAPALTG
ncbi:HNH endonuclease signature motif containing protein [Auraticoccus monumenti]|uniref:HNH endonuclease n=1 Tax=Auraticoccus monumenti TaxID=675864 RepID=A0A1G7E8I9_9ACTN|nr:HNH endonuclease signature motif containing protein [Auraticoccus monumenti]SDE59776.1 HNH endonuclease [Auraticoccus monumenti]